jgi:hypothetical protein
MTEDEERLVNVLPEDGSYMTNPEVQRRLGWESSVYWDIRNQLVERAILGVARGRGGLVYRIIDATEEIPTPEEVADEAVQKIHREEDLYEPIAETLNGEWAREKRFERWTVQITARQGRKDTGGRWSRPDLTVATQSTYPYIPGRHFDVITFEVKPKDGIDVTAVYEALAHLRAATKAYVLLHVPDDSKAELDSQLIEIYSEAKRHNVGVITMDDPGDFSGWDEVVEPARNDPEPRRLNDFLANQFDSSRLETLIRWFR